MKVYFAYSSHFEQLLREENVSIMLSFHERKRALCPEVPTGFREIMVDSGGFQLRTGVASQWELTLGGYCFWLQQVLPKYPEIVAYLNLDIPDDPEKSLANQLYMESQGLHPLPVWHIRSGDDYLNYYCENYEYVAIRGLVGGGLLGIQRVIERARHLYPQTRFHFLGVGVGAFQTFQAVRPYSVDCSTWADPGRFGDEILVDTQGTDKVLRTRKLPVEIRASFRKNRGLRMEYVRQAVRAIKLMGDMVEKLEGEWQHPLL